MSMDTVAELHALAIKMKQLTETWPAEQAAPVPQLLTFEQAASALSVSKTKLQEMVDKGELPVVDIARGRIDVRDIEKLIVARRARRA